MAKRFLAALLLLAGMVACAIAQESDHPLANAKLGDWAVYSTTSAQFKSTRRQEVVAIKGKMVTVKFTSTVNGLDLPASEQTFDVSKKVDPNVGVDKAHNLKIKETGVGKETLKVNGKDYVCDWRANHIIATAKRSCGSGLAQLRSLKRAVQCTLINRPQRDSVVASDVNTVPRDDFASWLRARISAA